MSDVGYRKLTPEQIAQVKAIKPKLLEALGGPYAMERDPMVALLALLESAAAVATYPWNDCTFLPMSESLFAENAQLAHRSRTKPEPSRQS